MRITLRATLILAGGACASYQAAPVDPAAFAASYANRSIGDSAFIAYRLALGRTADNSRWTPEDYGFAALYFRSGLDEARAEVRVAEAGRKAAGARERPGVAGSAERNLQHSDERSPWGVQLTPTFVLETGGKRGARIAIAESRTLAATARLHVEAWETANAARTAAITSLTLSDRLSAVTGEMLRLDSLLPLIQARYADGGVNQIEVTRIRTESDLAHVEVVTARSEWKASLARLAVASGLPPGGVPDIPGPPDSTVLPVARLADVIWPGPGCGGGPLSSIPRDTARTLAIGSRWEVAEALAQYQVAEGELRLAVAEQRPDLQLGPGLFFDHGVTRFLINFALPFLPGGNHGRIAEAEERRRAAATHLESVQEGILGEVDQALASCDLAAANRDSALQFLQAAAEHKESLAQAYARGEIGRLEVAQAGLQDSRAWSALLEFVSQFREARAALESATGKWYTMPETVWPDPTVQPLRPRAKESP